MKPLTRRSWGPHQLSLFKLQLAGQVLSLFKLQLAGQMLSLFELQLAGQMLSLFELQLAGQMLSLFELQLAGQMLSLFALQLAGQVNMSAADAPLTKGLQKKHFSHAYFILDYVTKNSYIEGVSPGTPPCNPGLTF